MMTTPKMAHPAFYRASQFFAALKAMFLVGTRGGLTAADEALVTTILTILPQQRLFARMSPNDQRHALAVACTLQRAGYDQPALLQAALLHDVAKSMGQPIVHRVLIVLLKAFWPSGLQRLSEPVNQRMVNGEWRVNAQYSPIRLFAHSLISDWRRPFVIHAQHPAIGAAWAEEAGCEPLAVRLIARHQETLKGKPAEEEEKLLAALQWADGLN
jgi:hypothetical protein